MKRLIILLWIIGLSAQVRIGDMRSITSSLNVRDMTPASTNIFLATGGGLVHYESETEKYTVYTKDHGPVSYTHLTLPTICSV